MILQEGTTKIVAKYSTLRLPSPLPRVSSRIDGLQIPSTHVIGLVVGEFQDSLGHTNGSIRVT